jgi:thioredoxin-related protein
MTARKHFGRLCLLAALLLTVSRLGGISEASAHDTLPPGIAWIDGDVEQALAEARKSDRPVFLYWGAIWCPPCNQVKTVLFRRASFQNRMRAFVPVYLDGDAQAAQIWGDRFHVVGYPTLLILQPDGSEWMRLPGEVDPERIVQMLDLAVSAAHPVQELDRRVGAGQALTDGEWQMLASYGWELDGTLPPDSLSGRLARLAQAAPLRLPGVAGRLWLHALFNLTPQSTPWDSQGAAATLQALLGDAKLTRDSRDLLIQSPTQALAGLAPLSDAVRTPLVQAWRAALQTLAADPAISCTERLAMAGSAADLDLAGRNPVGRPLPSEDFARARALVQECDRGTLDELERQSVMSAASDLQQQLGLYDEAAALLEAEIPRAHVPAYFMQERAGLARRIGNGADAVEWSAMAYAHAIGGATRLQWAVRHLQDRIKYTPERHASITDLGAVVLREAGTLPDAFADRNLRSLKQLRALLDDWAAHQPVTAAERERLHASWAGLCRALPAGAGPAPAFCTSKAGA